MSEFFIGFDRLPQTPLAEGEPRPELHLRPDTLLRHMMALGSSGSGKTVLCKILTEEMVRHGLPAICIDPQGDLCSLAMNADNPEFLREKGIDPELAEQFAATVDPVIFTPASRKGIALSADPMAIDVSALKPRDRLYALTSMATMVVSLLGYDLDSDDGAGLVAVFDQALSRLLKLNTFPRNLEQFTTWLLKLDDATKEELSRYLDVRKIEHACQKLARLDVGARRLLFHEGLALDIELLLGLGNRSAAEDGKTRLSIIYLNTLNSQEDKEFFVAALVERLYTWMLRNPSKEPQAMFYIDEVAPFIPPVRKPACKPALSLLFKQARKYGICCLMATQNPADVDYKAMAQFGTWAIGRLTTRQDMKKVEPTVKALDPVNVDAIMEELPAQKPGQFVLISPDNFAHTHRLQCRWLYTKHETLDDERIEQLMDLPWLPEPPEEPDPDAEPDPDFEPPPEPITIRERFEELEHALVTQELEETVVPEPEDQDDEPLPEDEEEELEEELPPDTPRTGPSSTATLQTDPEIEQSDRTLAKASSMSTKEFARKAGLGEAAARGRLARLYAAKRAKKYKNGRENRYYSLSTGLRPDLGLDGNVKVIVSRVTRNDAERAAREVRRSSTLFGLIGDDEVLDHAELDHRLVMQLSFTEKVTRMFLKRMFGGRRHDEMLDSIYLHPQNMKIAIFDPTLGVRLEDKPEDYASKIIDFDGAVTFEEMRPSELRLNEREIRKRKSDDTIKESFTQRFNAKPKRIEPVFLPVWNLHLKSRTRTSTRVVVIDALVGKALDW